MAEFTPTHCHVGGEHVKAVQWSKDGDHPSVERYPHERRNWKGLLRQGKQKFALMFGDWVLEDSQGRMWVVSGQKANGHSSPFEWSYKELA